MKKYLCFDIGGLSLKFSVYDKNLKSYLDQNFDYELLSKDKIWLKIAEVFNQYKKEFNLTDEIFVSSSGIVNNKTNQILWIGVNSEKSYKKADDLLNLPSIKLYLDNDARCALRAESFYGNAIFKNAVLLTIGTALGGAIKVNGEIINGQNFLAGEIGAGKFKFNDDKNISQQCGMYNLTLNYLAMTGEKISGKEVWRRAYSEDIIADDLIQAQTENIAVVIVNMFLTLNTEQFVIGGAISQNESFIALLNEKVEKLLISINIKKTFEIVPSKFLNDAGKIGALSLKRDLI